MNAKQRGYYDPIVTLLLLIVLFLTFGLPVGGYLLEKVSCRRQADGLNLEHYFTIVEGCMVRIDERRWVKIGRIRISENGRLGIGAEDE